MASGSDSGCGCAPWFSISRSPTNPHPSPSFIHPIFSTRIDERSISISVCGRIVVLDTLLRGRNALPARVILRIGPLLSLFPSIKRTECNSC